MQNKEQQIEEMAKDIFENCNAGLFYSEAERIARFVIEDKDYRKASDVARETVEAIKAEVSKKEQYVNDLFGYGGYVIATTDLEDIICRYMFDTYEEAELKKKYEGEGK